MKKISKSPIISLNIYNAVLDKSSLTNVKGRPFYSLTYRKCGVAKIFIDGKTIVSRKDCITLTPKNRGYATEILEATNIIAIHFDCLLSNCFSAPFMIENNSKQIEKMFDEVFEKYSADDPDNFECYSIFYKILSEIDGYFKKKQDNKIKPKIRKAKAEIENSFRDPDFNISTLVDRLQLSPSYLRSEFKKAYSVSPVEYLSTVRQKNAIFILASDYYSVEEIARMCGYCSVSYFIQVFKKSTGYSPLKYKEKFLTK